jgi:hypothetical protein
VPSFSGDLPPFSNISSWRGTQDQREFSVSSGPINFKCIAMVKCWTKEVNVPQKLKLFTSEFMCKKKWY